MANQGRLMRYAAATAILLTLATANPRAMQPLVEGRLGEASSKTLFIPAYNWKQPNKISIAPTAKTAEFVEKLKAGNPSVKWTDEFAAGEFLMKEISKMKKAPDPAKSENRYLKSIIGKKEITSDTFFDVEDPQCTERSALLSASLDYLGFKGAPFFLDEKFSDTEYSGHTFVAQKTAKGTTYLDPTYGISSTQIGEFVSKYVSTTGKSEGVKKRLVYPAIEYNEGYGQKYGKSLEAEEKLRSDFDFLKKEIKE